MFKVYLLKFSAAMFIDLWVRVKYATIRPALSKIRWVTEILRFAKSTALFLKSFLFRNFSKVYFKRYKWYRLKTRRVCLRKRRLLTYARSAHKCNSFQSWNFVQLLHFKEHLNSSRVEQISSSYTEEIKSTIIYDLKTYFCFFS